MPEKKTIKKAQKAKRTGKSPSTQAGAFVHEEIDHERKVKHGAKNAKQVMAIGLSEARQAGVDLPGQKKKKVSRITKKKVSATRSKATTTRLKKEPTSSVSHRALARQTRSVAAKRK